MEIVSTSEKVQHINMPPYQVAHEKELSSAIVKMIEAITRQFINQIPLTFTAQTVGKFSDDQAGNYSARLLKMTKALKKKLSKRFSDERIEKLAKDILKKSKAANGNALYADASGVSGIPVKTLLMNERLAPQFNAMYAETAEWIKTLKNDHLSALNNNTLRMMTEGRGVDDIVQELVKKNIITAKKAGIVARQQVASFNGLASKIRAQKLGITHAEWVTAKDERVRTSHRERHGRVFSLKEGCPSSLDNMLLHVGTDFNCRCRAKMIIPKG